MKRSIVFIFLANLMVCSSVYSVHNFLKGLYKNSANLSYSDSSLLDILTVIRLVSGYIISNIADHTQYHCIMAIFCLIGYVLTICMVHFFSSTIGIKDCGLCPKLVIIDMYVKIFESGLFPIMETLVINASSFKGSGKRTYSYMRFSTVIGRFLGQFSNIAANYIHPTHTGDQKNNYDNMIYVALIYMSISIPVLILAHFIGMDKGEVKEINEDVKKETFLNSLKKILLSEYALVLIFLGFQGVHRTAISNYQSEVLNSEFENSKTRWIFCLRCIFEVLIELSAPYFEKRIGTFWIVLFGASAGISKTLAYAFYPTAFSKSFRFAYFQFFESFRALFSSFVGYGCTRLTKYYNAPNVQTSAQGLYNGMYNAVGAAVSGVIGYNTICDDADRTSFQKFFLITAIVGIVGLLPIAYLAVIGSRLQAISLRSNKI